ncbi:MAG: malto-oligosyltrehalose synthase [Candidatus Desulforudis sp.]|nr:malto-oligosyltrehalose synthase [Desulforudis sp.]
MTRFNRIPAATYRVQFNAGFKLAEARALVAYLDALGITDLYASPLLQARRGSAHGYDVTDPSRVNPELGGEEQLAALAGELERRGMGLVLDIVPNHMAAHAENPWWYDVLQYGPRSLYAAYFDIEWHPDRPGLTGKVLLPILGAPYGRVLENGELTLELTGAGLVVRYYDRELPVSPESYRPVLGHGLENPAASLGPEHPAFQALVDLVNAWKGLSGRPGAAFEQARDQLWHLYTTHPEVQSFVDDNLRRWNGTRGEPWTFDRLDRLLSGQAYRLAFWRSANRELNYRRFFDIADLVAMRVEDERVFTAIHEKVFALCEAGWVTGLRIDHIDGLHDPAAYLERLQDRLAGGKHGPTFYVVVEKILGEGEELPDWPVAGTTGYEFMNVVNALFVDEGGATALGEVYAGLTGSGTGFEAVVAARKRRMAGELFAGEVHALARQAGRLAEQDRHGRDLTLVELEQALVEVTVQLPVYRTYTRGLTVSDRDRDYVEQAVAAARGSKAVSAQAVDFLRRVLLLKCGDDKQREAWLGLVMRWQQFTGPVMAKGFEDTALYVYNRLTSLNEVGGEPQVEGLTVREFHYRNRARQARGPHALNATSTHDNKRSADVRARINVLSELPELWAERVREWRRWNHPVKPVLKGRAVPDDNTEYLFYQTLVGAWPLRDEELPEFRERVQDYMIKAAREAKEYTSWLETEDDYERALAEFVETVLEPGPANRFLEDFVQFQRPVAHYGALGSLAQVLLKITSPGVPDFYQGSELWDFSLVDPDNRRPVDFEARAALLAEIRTWTGGDRQALVREVLDRWEDGRVKLYLTYQALQFRRSRAALFTSGEYRPLGTAGGRGEHVCAFARYLGDTWIVTAVPRLPVKLLDAGRGKGPVVTGLPLGEAVWGESVLLLPSEAPEHWRDVFTGERLTGRVVSRAVPPGKTALALADVFRHFPAALLAGENPIDTPNTGHLYW